MAATDRIDAWAKQGKLRKVVKALDDHREFVRFRAATALGQMHDERAVEPLKAMAYQPADEWGAPFRMAMQSLGAIEGTAAADALLELFANPPTTPAHPQWHLSAASALGQVRDPRAIGALKTWAYATGDEDGREAAIYGIAAIPEPAAADALLDLVAAHPDSVPPETVESVRMTAAPALAAKGGDRAVEALTAFACEARSGAGGDAAIRGIVRIGGAGGVDALVALVTGSPGHGVVPAESVRIGAARGLARIGGERAIAPLAAVGGGAVSGDLRDTALRSIVQIGGPAAGDALLGLFAGSDGARNAAAEALGDLGEERAVEPLRQWLGRTGDGDRRRLAIRAIARIGGPAAGDALSRMLSEPALRSDVATALADVGDVQALPQVFRLLGDPSVDSLRSSPVGLLGALGRLGCRRAVPPLCELLLERLDTAKYGEDDLSRVVLALGDLGDPRAVPALCRTLEWAQDTLDGTHRRQVHVLRRDAVRAVGAIGDPSALETLRKIRRRMSVPSDERLAAAERGDNDSGYLQMLESKHDAEAVDRALDDLEKAARECI